MKLKQYNILKFIIIPQEKTKLKKNNISPYSTSTNVQNNYNPVNQINRL